MKTPRPIVILLLMCGLAQAIGADDPGHTRPRTTPKKSASPAPAVRRTAATAPTTAPAQESDEDRHFREVKAQAMADPAVQNLKAKSDAATTATDARETSIAYNRALFSKMRELDKSVSERAELVENAILRRISE